MKIKKGDQVKAITGKDKGKTGKVLQVFVKEERIAVEGLNILTKHLRPQQQGQKGQKVEFPALMRVSNVMLVCPKCQKSTRVSYKVLEDKRRVRMCRKCQEVIE